MLNLLTLKHDHMGVEGVWGPKHQGAGLKERGKTKSEQVGVRKRAQPGTLYLDI